MRESILIVGAEAVIDAALERDDLEAHLLVQELDQAGLDRAELGGPMGAFAELDHAPVADRLLEELEVGEVRVRRIRGADRDVIVLEPALAARRLLAPGSRQDENDGARQSGLTRH